MKNNSLFLILFASVLFSCVPAKDVVYFQGIDNANSSTSVNYEPVIKADDILYINVSTLDPKAAEPFNLGNTEGQGTGGAGGGVQLQRLTYLVKNDGTIQFPVLGTLKVGGLTKAEVTHLVSSRISEFVKDAVINIRIMNFKISVLGEVNSPGSFVITNERITIPEALALAGDMTLFGKRENILLIREVQGVKSTLRLDMTNPEIINSPYYYLTQNDVLYIEPNKRKINSTAIGPNILAGISILGFAITTVLLLTK